jgi:hypothetical protein
MALALGRQAEATEFQDEAARRARFLRAQGAWPKALPQHALTNAVLAGLVSSFPAAVPSTTTTPYFSYYVLEALSKAGQDPRAEQAVQDYWGGMLKLGATSTWEYFLPSWVHSLKPCHQPPDEVCGQVSFCHPWSSGATAWLSEHVLGVTPSSPGFQTCQVRPFFGRLKWANGRVPTPAGPVSVSWEILPSGPRLEVSAPKAVELNVVLPGRYVYRVDGRSVVPRRLRGGEVGLLIEGGGRHRVSAVDF